MLLNFQTSRKIHSSNNFLTKINKEKYKTDGKLYMNNQKNISIDRFNINRVSKTALNILNFKIQLERRSYRSLRFVGKPTLLGLIENLEQKRLENNSQTSRLSELKTL